MAYDPTQALRYGVDVRIYPLFETLGYKRQLPSPMGEEPGPLRLQYARSRDGYVDEIEILWRNGDIPQFVIEWMTSQVERMHSDSDPEEPLPGRIYRGPKPFFSMSSEMAWFRHGKDLSKELDIVERRVRELDAYLKDGPVMEFISLK